MVKILSKKSILAGTAVVLVAGGIAAVAYAAQTKHGHHWGHGGHMRWMESMLMPMDSDNDGSITRAEIESGTAAKAAEVDANKDGNITAEEVVAYREKQRLQRLADEIKAMDQDGNGAVSVAEYEAAQVWRIARLDRDGNGTIDPDELRPHRGPHDGMPHRQ
jgi:Ca2+-binding EF-hand superfamily protein